MSERSAEKVLGYLAKAEESLTAARELLGNGHPEFAASRAYYAAFYAATAALFRMGLQFSTHRGLIGAVHQHFVKTGKLPSQAGEAIRALIEARMVGDYEALPAPMPTDEAREAIRLAESFVAQIKSLLKKEEGK